MLGKMVHTICMSPYLFKVELFFIIIIHIIFMLTSRRCKDAASVEGRGQIDKVSCS